MSGYLSSLSVSSTHTYMSGHFQAFKIILPAFVVCLIWFASIAPTGIAAQPQMWPPRLGMVYPDLVLPNQDGKPTRLSSFKGKVILIEPIGMSCPACQAFVGGGKPKVGGFQGCNPQQGMPDFADYCASRNISLDNPDLVLVQLLLYSPSMGAPSISEAQAWDRHFSVSKHRNRVILLADSSFINNASYNMIPGFQLVDRNFILAVDAAGHAPRNNLWEELVPQLGQMLASNTPAHN